jgi:hypothetical protein
MIAGARFYFRSQGQRAKLSPRLGLSPELTAQGTPMFMFDRERHLATAFRIDGTPHIGRMTGSGRAAAAPRTGTIIDRFGFSHTSTSQAAIAAFERAVFGVAAHRP